MASSYITPVKRIQTPEDQAIFNGSTTHDDILAYVVRLAQSVHGLELMDETLPKSDHITSLLKLLDQIDQVSANHPIRHDTTSRFGKVEFRDFYDELKQKAPGFIDELQLQDPDAVIELQVYLSNAFGDRGRIDYGSGHELNFLCLLQCLDKLGYLTPEVDSSVVLKVFNRYLKTMRKLQLKYWLEPAGSHGVWGLDDYHFLPFLFGAAQLSPFKRPRPLSIHNKDYVEEFKDKYFYFACIDFINRTKTGVESLRGSSPMLDDISGVKTWSKIEEGMVKMYRAEVLQKLPVMQHFFFGSLLPCPDGISEPSDRTDTSCEHHIHSSWGNCCGIPVPSAVAASQSEPRHHIPFD